jgi:peptidoglycan/LPS O-acetylase OafA/YrhL
MPSPVSVRDAVSLGSASGSRLADVLDPRSNSLNALRLLFAAMVVIGHGQHVGFGQTPLHIGSMAIHDVAVDGFFVISGYLITASWLSSSSSRSYLRRRFARIFPGYWLCLAITALVFVPILWLHEHGTLAGLPWAGGAESAAGYIVTNGALYEHQQQVAGVLAHSHVPFAINGSLWTLFYEFGAYLGVIALGAVGVLTRRRWLMSGVVLGLGAGLLWFTADPEGFRAATHSPVLAANACRLGLMFAVGMHLRLWHGVIPATAPVAAVCAAIVAATVVLPDWRLVGAFPFGLLVLWLGARLPLRRVGQRTDLSYGVYLYGWPVLQLLWAFGLTSLGPPLYLTLALALSAALAWLSFVCVERPALTWARSRRPAAAPPRPRMTWTVGVESTSLTATATGATNATLFGERVACASGHPPRPMIEVCDACGRTTVTTLAEAPLLELTVLFLAERIFEPLRARTGSSADLTGAFFAASDPVKQQTLDALDVRIAYDAVARQIELSALAPPSLARPDEEPTEEPRSPVARAGVLAIRRAA